MITKEEADLITQSLENLVTIVTTHGENMEHVVSILEKLIARVATLERLVGVDEVVK